MVVDTILCSNKEEAKRIVDGIGAKYIEDFEFYENGKVRVDLNCSLAEIAQKEKDDRIWNEALHEMADMIRSSHKTVDEILKELERRVNG